MLARACARAALQRLRDGSLTVVEDGERTTYGDGDGPCAELTVHDPRAWSAVLRRGSIGLGEAYAAGWFDADDLPALMELGARNLTRVRRPLDRLARLVAPVRDRIPSPSRGMAADRSFVAAHYDLSNDLFALMLDPTMSYSCALFHGQASLEEAQEAKLDRLAALLDLGPSDHLLEIGTGWGGLAVHLAERTGCRITTTTISAEQHEYASKRVAEAGLANRVTVLDHHYRDLDGTYDKIVSVEMIEAVDWRDHRDYLETLTRLVRPGGRIALQAIVIDDAAFDRAKRTTDFIKAFVFPGGCLPSVASIDGHARAVGLRAGLVESIGASYPTTLAAWQANLDASRDELTRLGFDERFQRLWDLYLAFCIGAFRSGHIDTVHVLLEA